MHFSCVYSCKLLYDALKVSFFSSVSSLSTLNSEQERRVFGTPGRLLHLPNPRHATGMVAIVHWFCHSTKMQQKMTENQNSGKSQSSNQNANTIENPSRKHGCNFCFGEHVCNAVNHRSKQKTLTTLSQSRILRHIENYQNSIDQNKPKHTSM